MAIIIPILIFIFLSIGLTWFFLANDHGEKEPIGALWIAFGLGFLGAIAAAAIEYLVIPHRYVSMGAQPISLGLLASFLGVGLIEEFAKFVPLSLFIYRRRYFNEHIDGIIYFGLAGLGFGLPENILYTVDFGLKTGLMRLVLTPFFHVATTALIGYFLIRAKLDHKPRWQVVAAFVAMALLHGLYDFGLSAGNSLLLVGSLIAGAIMTAMLFILYMRAGEIDQAAGLATVGRNAFCRHCGLPNPKHNQYCNRCGQRA